MIVLYIINSVLCVIGAITIIELLIVCIMTISQKVADKRDIKNKLRIVSRYCDTHIVPIWAEEKAVDQIKHDYPLDRVLRILRSHEIDPKEVTTKLKQVGTVVDSKEEE